MPAADRENVGQPVVSNVVIRFHRHWHLSSPGLICLGRNFFRFRFDLRFSVTLRECLSLCDRNFDDFNPLDRLGTGLRLFEADCLRTFFLRLCKRSQCSPFETFFLQIFSKRLLNRDDVEVSSILRSLTYDATKTTERETIAPAMNGMKKTKSWENFERVSSARDRILETFLCCTPIYVLFLDLGLSSLSSPLM